MTLLGSVDTVVNKTDSISCPPEAHILVPGRINPQQSQQVRAVVMLDAGQCDGDKLSREGGLRVLGGGHAVKIGCSGTVYVRKWSSSRTEGVAGHVMRLWRKRGPGRGGGAQAPRGQTRPVCLGNSKE